MVDEEGTVIGVCLNARDITTRKEAERAVRESESRYSDLFDNASDLVCATDPDGAFLYVNRAWHASIGLSDVELRSHRFIDVVHPDSRERYAEVVERVLTGETLTHVDLVLVTASGATITVEGNLSCTLGDGRPVVVRGIYRDITERKRVEEQLRQAERMQAAGRAWAGGMAHEVNNMMTGVLGFSEFLLRSLEEDDPRRAEVPGDHPGWLPGPRTSPASSWRSRASSFSRPEAAGDLNAVVRGVERMLRRSLGEDNVLELPPDRGGWAAPGRSRAARAGARQSHPQRARRPARPRPG